MSNAGGDRTTTSAIRTAVSSMFPSKQLLTTAAFISARSPHLLFKEPNFLSPIRAAPSGSELKCYAPLCRPPQDIQIKFDKPISKSIDSFVIHPSTAWLGTALNKQHFSLGFCHPPEAPARGSVRFSDSFSAVQLVVIPSGSGSRYEICERYKAYCILVDP